jgi:glucose-6-phosphate isomerase
VDKHFQTEPFLRNVPMLMAALGIWNTNILGASTLAILPYAQLLHRFSAYLQQGEMESNGKRVTREGKPVPYKTCPIVWGEPGTNGQHAFYQLIHQGTQLVPCDFILAMQTAYPMGAPSGVQQDMLVANCLSQAEALMRGKTEAEARAELVAKGAPSDVLDALTPHKVFPGNIPSSLLVTEKLTPHALGELIALYEHKIFTQGVLWNVASFDQWGVELGKELAQTIMKDFAANEAGKEPAKHDASTTHWISSYAGTPRT